MPVAKNNDLTFRQATDPSAMAFFPTSLPSGHDFLNRQCTIMRSLIRKGKETPMFFFFLVFFMVKDTSSYAQNGKALFQLNCASCHNPIKVVTGPALKGVTDRVTDQQTAPRLDT